MLSSIKHERKIAEKFLPGFDAVLQQFPAVPFFVKVAVNHSPGHAALIEVTREANSAAAYDRAVELGHKIMYFARAPFADFMQEIDIQRLFERSKNSGMFDSNASMHASVSGAFQSRIISCSTII